MGQHEHKQPWRCDCCAHIHWSGSTTIKAAMATWLPCPQPGVGVHAKGAMATWLPCRASVWDTNYAVKNSKRFRPCCLAQTLLAAAEALCNRIKATPSCNPRLATLGVRYAMPSSHERVERGRVEQRFFTQRRLLDCFHQPG